MLRLQAAALLWVVASSCNFAFFFWRSVSERDTSIRCNETSFNRGCQRQRSITDHGSAFYRFWHVRVTRSLCELWASIAVLQSNNRVGNQRGHTTGATESLSYIHFPGSDELPRIQNLVQIAWRLPSMFASWGFGFRACM